jgi:uncharacterized surface protein with fasciclin (FAS1) repeats
MNRLSRGVAIVSLAVSSSLLTSQVHAANIVATAVAAGDFKTLVAAIQAAGLKGTLDGKGPFTVFAPTDEAFAALPAGTVESLLKPENKSKLVSILTYHVVPGDITSANLAGKTTMAKTVEGESLDINAAGRAVRVNDATVTKADISADNGVIHVINKVLLPK